MIHYLSVHDLVWINTTATGETLSFDYEKLEQAMAAQYSYGDSRNIVGQAANLLGTIVQRQPFEYGNRRTAYVATLTFLLANGFNLTVDSKRAAELVLEVDNGSRPPEQAIVEIAEPSGTELLSRVSLRAIVTQLFNQHADAIQKLAEGDS